MNKSILTNVLDNNVPYLFDKNNLRRYFNTDNSFNDEMDKALKKEDIYYFGDNFYIVNPARLKRGFDLHALMKYVDKDCYISDFSALSNNDWTCDGVSNYFITSKKYDCVFANKYGLFFFKKIQQENWQVATHIVEWYSMPFLEAKPLKALCEYLIRADFYTIDYFKYGILDWLEYSIRIMDDDCLTELKKEDFDELLGNYPNSPIVDEFLNKFRGELGV